MKTPARFPFLAALVPSLVMTVAVLAQEAPPASAPAGPADPAPEAPPAAVSTPAEDQRPEAAPQSAPDSAAPEAPEPDATETEPEPTELRRLDTPTAAEPADETEMARESPDAPDKAPEEAVDAEAAAEPDADVEAEPAPAPVERRARRDFNHRAGKERVSIWLNSHLAEGESADAVVSIVGSSTSEGRVRDAVVSILGSSTSSGEVGDAVVSVFGNSRVLGGSVGDAVVSVMGNSYVNGKVRGEVVAVLGNIELGPDAEIGGDLVSVGGRVIRDPGAIVHGQIQGIAFGVDFGGFEWLHAWVAQCLMYGRPLAFGPNLMWVWWLTLGFFLLYLVLALLFPRGIERCSETLEQRPGLSVLTAFLVTLLTPAAAILLSITVVGTPALLLAMTGVSLFGKAVMFAWVGRRITKLFSGGPLTHPAVAVAIGGIIIILLYTIPIVGFIVLKLTSWLGAGVVIYTLILGMKRDKPAGGVPSPVAPAPAVPPLSASGPATASIIAPAPGATGEVPPAAGESAIVAPLAPPPVVSATTQPRAGFWIRLAASFLDALIVAVAINLLPHGWQPNFLLAFGAYCIVLWATKATTIGGIICGLKVVRLDDRPVDWPTALVRVLGGFVSLIPAGLGFIWVVFDDGRQSWHDKIAGTVVVSVPRGVSLV